MIAGQLVNQPTNTDLISALVENVRLDQHPEDSAQQRDTEAANELARRHSDASNAELKEAQLRAEKAIIKAEKFCASVKPPGNLIHNNKVAGHFNQEMEQNTESLNILNIGEGVSDDDFFHLTCHIEPSLIHKIEKGEFVELEKLLPKDQLGRMADEGRLEWVQCDGSTYLVPAQKDNKIGSFRRWEQAFRAYATIYCGAHPHRSKEIWQYITVINTAASSYQWENVYNYDITFRHLMAFNPQRSWVVTYNQMWNLSMRDPLPKSGNGRTGGYAHYSGGGYVANRNGSTNQNPMQVRRNKSDYCWNFNKGVPCKFGENANLLKDVNTVTHLHMVSMLASSYRKKRVLKPKGLPIMLILTIYITMVMLRATTKTPK